MEGEAEGCGELRLGSTEVWDEDESEEVRSVWLEEEEGGKER